MLPSSFSVDERGFIISMSYFPGQCQLVVILWDVQLYFLCFHKQQLIRKTKRNGRGVV